MNINKLIIDSLKPLNIPIARLKYTGDKTTYIVFQEYLEQGESHSEDTEDITGHYIQINVFSKADYTSLVAELKARLINVGFKRQNEYEMYEMIQGFITEY